MSGHWVTRKLLRLAGAFALAACGLAAQAAEAYVFPSYSGPAQVEADCQRLLADLARQREAVAQMASEPTRDLLAALDAMTRRADATLGPLSLLESVHPDKALRDASEACDLAVQSFVSEFNQDARIFALLQAAKPQDAIDRSDLRDQLEAFEDAGAALPPAAQARARELNAAIAQRAQDFDRRIREDQTRVAFSAAELAGVPESLWQAAPRDRQGRTLLGVDETISGPVIRSAASAATRERMWRALFNVGGDANLQTLAELAALRREYARLFGFESYAELVLRRRMLSREADVHAFLASVKDAVRQRELSDLAALRAAKAEHLDTPLAATTLQQWDLAFYVERVRRERLGVTQESFRDAFAPDAALAFVFELAHRLFGVRFTPLAQTLWHADVRAFEVRESASGDYLGTLYVDLYPRAGKDGSGAYVATISNGSTLTGQRPAAALVANLDREGLTLDDLSATLLHEFGHALHVLLSQTRYAGQSGTNVKLDFSEAPSQMLEDWVYDPRVLGLFNEVCGQCAPVPPELLARADRARHFGDGIVFARQHLYASYDLALYGKALGSEPPDALALWIAMESATPLGDVAGSRLPASFSHIAGSYAAGYYSYLWSLALAADLRTAFAADRLSADTGGRYRRTILESGGQVPPAELMQQFLGRPRDNRAFFDMLATP